MPHKFRLSSLLVAGHLLLPLAIFAQGSLTPPGAPGPTMVTLDQINTTARDAQKDAHRTPIFNADVPLTISTSGSYYLAENLTVSTDTSAIIIAADDVSLDLNGRTITGPGKGFTTATSAMGVRLSATNIRVSNGTVRDWPSSAVGFSNITPLNARVTDVTVKDSGVGIVVGSSSIVERCRVDGVTNVGISASTNSTIRHCIVSNSGISQLGGIRTSGSSLIEHCRVSASAGPGFTLGGNSSAIGCFAISNAESGFELSETSAAGVQILNCTAATNGGNGFTISNHGLLQDSIARANTGSGVFVPTSASSMRIVGCQLSLNRLDGIQADSAFRGEVRNCNVDNSSRHGINVGTLFTIVDNQSVNSGGGTGITDGAGIRVTTAGLVRGNYSAFNDVGIAATANSNYFTSNVLRSNTTQKSLSGSTEGTGDLANVSF